MKTIKQLFMLVALICTATSAWATKQAYVVLTSNSDPQIIIPGPMPEPGMPSMDQILDAMTATFYYDENMYSRPSNYGPYSMNTGTNSPEWLYNNNSQCITRVVFDQSFADYQPTTCYQWFYSCNNLHTITGLANLNTSQVTNMYGMFESCRTTTLDLSNFDTSNVTDMCYMFAYCNYLQTIYVGDGWDTSKVTSSSYMFDYCSNLVGENGTTYNSSYTDKTYARVDAEGTPGYLTLKQLTANFYYEGELLFTRKLPLSGGTVTLPSAAEMMNTYGLKNVTYTCAGQPFTAETVITTDVDVTINGTSIFAAYTVGETTATLTSSGYYCPYKSGDKNSTTQIIYEATEMNGAATIGGIAFKVANASELTTTTVDIYLGHKSSTTFSSSSDYMTAYSLTHVYHGKPTLGNATGWETRRFNVANFDYNGIDNLVVVVCRKSASYNSSLKYYYESKSDHALARSSDSYTNYGEISNTSNYQLYSYRPSAQFLYLDISNEDVVLTDAESYSITKNTEVASATYKKTLDSERVGKYQAWFVPFDYAITTSDLEKFDFFKINMIANAAQPGENPASDDVYIFLNPMAAGDVLNGNKPYVYRPKEAVTDYEFKTELATLHAKTDASVLQTSTTTATYDFYGTYTDTEAATAGPFYYVNINGNISRGTTVTVGPYRWILRATAKGGVSYAPKFVFSEGETTGINEVQGSGFKIQGSEMFYNLAGQRVSQPTKGLYIVNGKKVVIK